MRISGLKNEKQRKMKRIYECTSLKNEGRKWKKKR